MLFGFGVLISGLTCADCLVVVMVTCVCGILFWMCFLVSGCCLLIAILVAC